MSNTPAAPRPDIGANAPWAATYIGSATVLIDGPGLRLLTDPVLDACGTEWRLSRFSSDPAHRYVSSFDPGLRVKEIGRIDLVLLSHDQHRDNFDQAGLDVARRAGTIQTTVAGARRLMRKGLRNVVGLAPGDYFEYSGGGGVLRLMATAARHGYTGTNWLAGDVIGFVLDHATLGRAYITGDTVWFDRLTDIRRGGPIDFLFAHLGAARFGSTVLSRWLRWSMNAEEAVRLAKALDVARVLPIHFEGWSHYTEGRDAVADRFAAAGLADRLIWLPRGSRVQLPRKQLRQVSLSVRSVTPT